MEKDSDDKGCLLTGYFFAAAMLSVILIYWLTESILYAVIPAAILFLIGGVCAASRDEGPSNRFGF